MVGLGCDSWRSGDGRIRAQERAKVNLQVWSMRMLLKRTVVAEANGDEMRRFEITFGGYGPNRDQPPVPADLLEVARKVLQQAGRNLDGVRLRLAG